MKVLYEDNHIIVVEKMPNVPSQADKTGDEDMLTIIKNYLKEKYNKPGNVYLGLVHRLDRPVGGVMVFAKTSKAASRLSEEIRNKTFKKTYLAIVNGKMESESGEYVDYLWKDEKQNTSYVVKEGKKNSKLAKLNYEVIAYNERENVSLVKINLQTGRHHQIRVQFSSRMHALYGDSKYHGRGAGSGICLWAYKIKFVHPVKKEEMEFEDCPPKEGMWEKLWLLSALTYLKFMVTG